MPNQTTTIESLSHEGRGVAHINGKTVFIEGALPGETVEFEKQRSQRKFDEGQVVKVINAAADRAEPLCAHFSICGGCSLQHLQASAQIQFKQQVLLEQLQHIGGVTPKTLLPPLLGQYWGYRRKARLGVRYVNKKNKLLVGFREKNGRYLADIDQCEVLHPSVGKKIPLIRDLITSLAAYLHIPQLEIAVGDNATALIFRHLQPLSSEDHEKLSQLGKTHHYYIFLQPGGPQTAHLLYPENAEPFLNYQLPQQQLTLWFHPTDFTQINADINQQMVTRTLELLQPEAHEKILDLFCGLGNFSLPLAQQCGQVIGVEGDAAMVARCELNATRNQITHAQFFCANLAGDITVAPWTRQSYDKILLDPPRTGAWEMIPFLGKSKAKRILYISCNPATLARDAAGLVQQGYQLTQAGVMDMFPHTSHVEAMAVFERINS